MPRYVFIALIVTGVVAFALAGWTVKGVRRLARSASVRPALRPAFA